MLLYSKFKLCLHKLDEQCKPILMGVDGSTLHVVGTKRLQVHFEGQQFVISVVVVESLQMTAIMGMDFLESYQCVIVAGSKSLQIKGLKHLLCISHHCFPQMCQTSISKECA